MTGVEEDEVPSEDTPVDEAELEDIFGDDDSEKEETKEEDKEKRTIPWQLGMTHCNTMYLKRHVYFIES